MTRSSKKTRITRATVLSHSGLELWLTFAAIIVISIATLAASDRDDDDRDRVRTYAIGLWGDVPYSDIQEIGVVNLIKDMNNQRLAFTVHDGDLKQGNGSPVCDNALYAKALDYFNSLKAPAMFTPGDNDWTDCDRPGNGGFDSLERLSYERAFLFADDHSFGQHTLRQHVQGDALCLGGSNASPIYEGCVENRRWTVGGVMYATLNIQGSCNNLCGVGFNVTEYAARNAANIAWMEATFEEATRRHSVAIMFISQGDPASACSSSTRRCGIPRRLPRPPAHLRHPPLRVSMASGTFSSPCAQR